MEVLPQVLPSFPPPTRFSVERRVGGMLAHEVLLPLDPWAAGVPLALFCRVTVAVGLLVSLAGTAVPSIRLPLSALSRLPAT